MILFDKRPKYATKEMYLRRFAYLPTCLGKYYVWLEYYLENRQILASGMKVIRRKHQQSDTDFYGIYKEK